MIPISVRRKPTIRESSDDPVELMLACHERIRSFSALALRLAQQPEPPEEQAAEAASAVHRYFSIALPLHVADEDLSIRPRLDQVTAPTEVSAALSQMSLQHLDIDRVLAEALPLWLGLARREARWAECLDKLQGVAVSLGARFDAHLELEERTIFPAIRALLPAAERIALADEIRERRQQS